MPRVLHVNILMRACTGHSGLADPYKLLVGGRSAVKMLRVGLESRMAVLAIALSLASCGWQTSASFRSPSGTAMIIFGRGYGPMAPDLRSNYLPGMEPDAFFVPPAKHSHLLLNHTGPRMKSLLVS